MDDQLMTAAKRILTSQQGVGGQSRRSARLPAAKRLVALTAVVFLAGSLSGCSLFVMAGKMFFGDPKLTAPFHNATGVDLTQGEHTVLVIVSTSESVKSEFPSIDFDLTEQTIRRLKQRKIKVVDPDEIAGWIDDNGGYWDDPSDLAEHFDTDFIIHVDLDTFTCKEENSPQLLRGRAEGEIVAYRVQNMSGKKRVKEIFVREFLSTHPRVNPISSDHISRRSFEKQYIDRVATQISQMLYDFRASELFD